jgi:hypothetical protein
VELNRKAYYNLARIKTMSHDRDRLKALIACLEQDEPTSKRNPNPFSGDRNCANSVGISGWLNEKPNEGHWTAIAKLIGLGDGNGRLESKI